MSFPRDSAFKQAMDAGAGQPPLRTPEDNQRIADEQRANPTRVFIPISDMEGWIGVLEDLVEFLPVKADQEDLIEVINEMRSYFKG